MTATAKSLLRLMTCGSVDDGKSTLIGRMLFESRLIMDDTLAALRRDSGLGEPDLAFLVDGLEEERQQGITIDVAHRYFATPARAYILADTPGHEQFTRNMATAASRSDVAVILVDARHGLRRQTLRHAAICARFGIRDILLAVNKMDLVGYEAATFDRIAGEFAGHMQALGKLRVTALPLSALQGVNVTRPADQEMPWYTGPTVLGFLDQIEPESDAAGAFRMPVQWISRAGSDFRGYAGTVAGGTVRVGDRIQVVQSGRQTQVRRIVTADGDLPRAGIGQAITLVLEDDLAVARGDLICDAAAPPPLADQFAAELLWLDDEALLPGRQYRLRAGHCWISASVTDIRHGIDIATNLPAPARALRAGEIGLCHLSTARPLPIEAYSGRGGAGAFILTDRLSERTVGAGMMQYPLHRSGNNLAEALLVDRPARSRLIGQQPRLLWFTGLSGAGKSTIAKRVEEELHRRGRLTYLLDGDNLRRGLNRDLGFSEADRVENIRRAGEIAALMLDAGLIVLCAFISPFEAERQAVRERFAPGEFFEIFVDTPLEVCRQRDSKGLYKRAMAGEIPNFTGISSPYEVPSAPDLHLKPGPVDELVQTVLQLVL